MLKQECEHLASQVTAGVEPQATECQDCSLPGPLRMCMTCGYVGCCESLNSHDTVHWKNTGHAIIRKLPLADDSFTWCYEHQAYLR